MKARVFVLAVLTGSTLAPVAQVAVHAANKLTIGPRRELSFGSVRQTVGSPKCDAAGNVYSRPRPTLGYDQSDNDFFLAPTKQVTPEGKTIGSFSVTSAWQDSVGRGVFVDGKGTVYQAAIARGGVYVVAFAQDGSVKAKTKLHTRTDVDPWHIAVFDSGRLLISGLSEDHWRTPYTSVFEASGALVKQIYEPEDEDARSKAVLGDPEFTYNSEHGNSFVHPGGDVTLGSDGDAYLLHGPAALVYVISPAGQVIRKMQIGVGDSKLPFRSIKSYQGQLAIGLATYGHIDVRVTNLDGVAAHSYGLDSNETDVLELACYDSRGFTFISGASGGNAYLLSAKP
jgi:hypothetical protein